ncbi:uncharacterized protein DEA37_0003436 [Paragonimus westermani]|uniref:C2H2-type domain-containing protein n=1 Tax=Paragonimus westermani TaxID=34504 RepID=A0A5J4NGS4_9TREM|nr:uncharacterized protein DEA37_0003436 [Paragonimus westermani]
MVETAGNSSVTMSVGEASFEHSNNVVSDLNMSDSLLHLLWSQKNADEKFEAAVHPVANLEMLTGAYRGPAIPPSLLKEYPCVCITCGVDFKSRATLHAHLMRHRHKLGILEQFTRLPMYECRSCEGGITCSSMLKHKCFSKQEADIKNRVKVLDRDGSPLVCILCRGRLLPSRVHLIIHIIVTHSIHRDPYKCVFCQTQFRSENLTMQEVHAFDCHAPELFMITRKACFKMIRNAKGGATDAAVPFTCFYDATKLEGADLSVIFKPKQNRLQRIESDGNPVAERTNVAGPKRRICTATFSTLDEYTTHLCCYHGAVAPERFMVLEEEDATEKVRRAKSQTNRVPGPTVRELLKSQAAGHHAPNKGNDDEFGTPALKSTKSHTPLSLLPRKTERMDKPGPMLRSRQWVSTTTYSPVMNRMSKQQKMCRVCLEHFQDEQRLNAHITVYHAPESRKRLKHLADKGKLSGILDIDLLCTECYIMFPDTLSLQVHMMVSHASKDWRHCGLCSYEFYSENGGTPNHLRLVQFSSNQDPLAATSRMPENSLLSDGGSPTDAWPLSAELMWRMIVTHETRHRERLFQPRPVLYLPVMLIDQLINRNAIQAVMAANWLVRKAQEEIEGVHATDEHLSNVPDLITTEEAFADVLNKTKLIGVDETMVEEAKASLISLLRHNEECQEDDAEKSRQVKPTSLQMSAISTARRTHLPAWLVHRFTELGELNATRQVESDFMENL